MSFHPLDKAPMARSTRLSARGCLALRSSLMSGEQSLNFESTLGGAGAVGAGFAGARCNTPEGAGAVVDVEVGAGFVVGEDVVGASNRSPLLTRPGATFVAKSALLGAALEPAGILR